MKTNDIPLPSDTPEANNAAGAGCMALFVRPRDFYEFRRQQPCLTCRYMERWEDHDIPFCSRRKHEVGITDKGCGIWEIAEAGKLPLGHEVEFVDVDRTGENPVIYRGTWEGIEDGREQVTSLSGQETASNSGVIIRWRHLANADVDAPAPPNTL